MRVPAIHGSAPPIGSCVMSVTSAGGVIQYGCSMTPGASGHTEGETVMLTLMTFTLFVLALALPGLVKLVLTGTTEVQ